jgi:hypothetical protein
MARSETFRELARYLRPAVKDAGDEAMSLIAGTHMRKDDRHGVVALLRDFEPGDVTYNDIQDFWRDSGTSFHLVGEEVLRSFLYKAGHVLEQSFSLSDIEDLRAGKTMKKRLGAAQRSASDNCTFLRLSLHLADIQSLDPDFKKDRRKLLLEE